MNLNRVNTNSEYFDNRELTTKIDDINVFNYVGWSGLELFKFSLSQRKKITNRMLKDLKPELIDKEKIFFTTVGGIKLTSNTLNTTLNEYDLADFTNSENFEFEALQQTEIFMISSNKSKNIKEKSNFINFKKDIERKNLWGNQIISRPYEGKELTLVLFELKQGFKFEDKGHDNEQFTWLIQGEMDFYSGDKGKLLNSNTGISIGANQIHGGISRGAIGFDAFFPKRNEIKYRNK